MIWEQFACEDCTLEIVATDTDRELLRRAKVGAYDISSLRELPSIWRDNFFESCEGQYRIKDSLRIPIAWLEQSVLNETPAGRFDLVLCRYLVFTYCELDLQVKILARITKSMNPGGVLILGQMERLPPSETFVPWIEQLPIYRRLKPS
jgi:chemotaxis methyl-accepting protein methylase